MPDKGVFGPEYTLDELGPIEGKLDFSGFCLRMRVVELNLSGFVPEAERVEAYDDHARLINDYPDFHTQRTALLNQASPEGTWYGTD